MDVREAIFSRRSIREYTSQTVDDETIHHLIEAAIYAPNAVNRQSWIFTVIRDQSVLESISGLAEAYVLTTDLGRDSDSISIFLDRPRFPHFLPCACRHPHFGDGEGAMDCRELPARSRKHDAFRPLFRPWYVLDRICAGLSQYAGRQGTVEPTNRGRARSADHRWASQIYSVRRAAEDPGRALDWLMTADALIAMASHGPNKCR